MCDVLFAGDKFPLWDESPGIYVRCVKFGLGMCESMKSMCREIFFVFV